MFRIPPEYRPRIREAQEVLKRAAPVLSALWYARGGGMLDKALAGATVVAELLKIIEPDASPHEQLLSLGYELIDTSLGQFLCERLRFASGVSWTSVDLQGSCRMLFWSLEGQNRIVAAIFDGDDFEEGPYVLGGDQGLLAHVVGQTAWSKCSDLQVVPKSNHKTSGRYLPPRSYALEKMKPVTEEDYIGDPSANEHANRLACYRDESRTIRIKGPTGVGKTLLARLLGEAVVGKEARTLMITSSALDRMPISDVIDLARYLEPDVLVLDDFKPDGGRYGGENANDSLAFLGMLHGKVSLVFITEMTEEEEGRYHRRSSTGKNYVDGMRPGRIDETLTLKHPRSTIRRRLIVKFAGGEEGLASPELNITKSMLDDIVERTAGLTGAYLHELVAVRFRKHGTGDYKREIRGVFDDAPAVPIAMRKAALGRVKVPTGNNGRALLAKCRRPALDQVAKKLSLPTTGNMNTVKQRIRDKWAELDATKST